MKSGMVVLVGVLMLATVGCGKTISELRTDGDVIVDNGGTFLKKVFDAGVAVYDIVKKVVEDTKDNVITVKETVVGK
jgi:hypothetical protein